MAFLGFHRRGRGRGEGRSARDWAGERKTLDWGERRYGGDERFGRGRDGDDYGRERYGSGSGRYGRSRYYEHPEESGQHRDDWRNEWHAGERGFGSERDFGGERGFDRERSFGGGRGMGERDYGRESWNDRWQESYGPRAGMGGREQSGYRGGMRGYDESSREPMQGAHWSPGGSSFTDFGRGGERSTYGAGQFRGRGPKGYKRSDERIREDVCECLTEDEHIDASNVEVQVKDCEVTLTGTVNSREGKRRAEDLIEDLPGVREVTNNLRVVNEAGRLEGAQSQTRQAGSQFDPTLGQKSPEQGARH